MKLGHGNVEVELVHQSHAALNVIADGSKRILDIHVVHKLKQEIKKSPLVGLFFFGFRLETLRAPHYASKCGVNRLFFLRLRFEAFGAHF